MKRKFTLLLSAIMMFATIAACGTNNNAASKRNDNEASEQNAGVTEVQESDSSSRLLLF